MMKVFFFVIVATAIVGAVSAANFRYAVNGSNDFDLLLPQVERAPLKIAIV